MVEERRGLLLFREPEAEDAAAMWLAAKGDRALGCEYSGVNMYMWRRVFGTQVAFAHGQAFVRFAQGDRGLYLLPMGGDLTAGLAQIEEHVAAAGEMLRLFVCGVEERQRLEAVFPGRFCFKEQRDEFDYLYRRETLASLSGKAFHGKRGHIAAFSRMHDWTFEDMGADNVGELLDMARAWYCSRGGEGSEGLQHEFCAIREALKQWQTLRLVGGVIRVAGQVVAFTYGSALSERVFDTHVEKALPEYAAAYTVINQAFAQRLPTHFELINRENDVGLEGLRKAKLSYRPEVLLEKFMAVEV